MLILDNQKNVYIDTETKKEYARVSTVLKSAGLINDDWYKPEDALRGTLVHKAAALYDQNNLDMASIDEKIKPYVAGWIKFREENNFTFSAMERIVCSDAHKIAGTLDRLAINSPAKCPAIIDIKTQETLNPIVAIQTAAYAMMLKEEGHAKIDRYAVQLKRNGDYKLWFLNNKLDFNVWASAINIYNFKKDKVL